MTNKENVNVVSVYDTLYIKCTIDSRTSSEVSISPLNVNKKGNGAVLLQQQP